MQTTFFGWRVVAGAFVLAVFGWGLGFYGPPVFLHAVQETRGWSTVLVSTAVTVHFLVGAIVVANLPGLYRRFGLPAVTRTGAVVLALGVVSWAVAREPWQLLLATLFSGVGWVAMGAAAVNAIVAPWFVARRPAALAMAYNGASIGGVVFSPLWVAVIAWLGFPMAAMGIGVALTAARPLAMVIAGMALLTFAFFGAHSTASSWVGRRAGPIRAQATSMFLFFYYLGGSIVGYLGGVAWGGQGWAGVVVLLEGCLVVALGVAIGLAFLRPLPGNEPRGAQRIGA